MFGGGQQQQQQQPLPPPSGGGAGGLVGAAAAAFGWRAPTQARGSGSFETAYELEQKLRSGSFATVWVGRHKESREEVAIKVIDRTQLKERDDTNVFREVEILKEVRDNVGVIHLVDFFVEPQRFWVVLELARGGDVFDRLSKRAVYTEKDGRELATSVLTTIRDLHSMGIVHRDLKPENLLLMSEVDDSSHVRVADFGFAKRLEANPPAGGPPALKLTTRCGTPAFVAPEILLGLPYDTKVDAWSCGVLLYLLLGGYLPFQHENHQGLFRKIRASDFVFHEKYWDNVSVSAKQLISRLLTVDPEARIDLQAALDSQWMTEEDEEVLSSRDLSVTLAELRKFCAKRKLRASVHAVTWAVNATFWNIDAISFNKDITDDILSGAISSGSTTSATSSSSSSSSAAAASPNSSASGDAVMRSPGGTAKLKKKGSVFADLYRLQTKIRTGSFATVWEGVHADTETKFAIKVVNRANLKPKDDAQFLNEVAILQSLKHPNIVCLRDLFEEVEYFYLVMDLCVGGDVFDRVVKRSQYTEKDAQDLIWTLLQAVEFIHSHDVAHRDLKPQNLLLTSLDDDADIKVADFGFAKRVHTPQSLTTRCGTPTYVAPEIIKNHPHDEAVDMWSVGVIMYVLLVGYPPFMEENQKVLFRKIRLGEYEFFPEDWASISAEAKDLIRQCLVVNPMHRTKAKEARQHAWFNKENADDLEMRDLSSSLDELRKSLRDAEEMEDSVSWIKDVTSPQLV